MSETGSETGTASDAVRLDELAAVTKEYATCARAAYGIASVLGGAYAFAVIAIDVFANWAWSDVLYLTLPAIWLVVVHASRAHYQRHGHVIEAQTPFSPRARRALVAFVYFVAVAQLAGFTLRAIATAMIDHEKSFEVAIAVTMVAFGSVAVPVLFSRVVRRRSDVAATLGFMMGGSGIVQTRPPPVPIIRGLDPVSIRQFASLFHATLLVLFALLATAIVVEGIRQHVRYRALERRLAELRGSA